MPNVTRALSGVDSRWPSGTSVSLYRAVMREGRWSPDFQTGVVASASVTGGGLSFANVPDDQPRYIAVGANGASAHISAGGLSWAGRH